MMINKNLTHRQFDALARSFASKHAGEKLVLGLIGPLGAGKTTFVKAFAETLGASKVKSPSFVITHEYELRTGRKLIHLDFYRLHSPTQLPVLGLDEILAGSNLVLIEWVDKFPGIQNRCDLLLTISVNPNGTRNVQISKP